MRGKKSPRKWQYFPRIIWLLKGKALYLAEYIVTLEAFENFGTLQNASERLWKSSDIFGPLWMSLDVFGRLRMSLDVFGCLWTSSDRVGFSLKILTLPEDKNLMPLTRKKLADVVYWCLIIVFGIYWHAITVMLEMTYFGIEFWKPWYIFMGYHYM